MSIFWEGVGTGVLATLIVFVICARVVLAQMNKRGRQALEQLATDTLNKMKDR